MLLKAPQQSVFPEGNLARGDTSAWEASYKPCRDMLAQPDLLELKFDATFPEIIGYVPESERAIVPSLPVRLYDMAFFPLRPEHRVGNRDRQPLIKNMPGTIKIIEADLALAAAEAVCTYAAVKHSFTEAGQSPLFQKPHIDARYNRPEQPALPIYLVSNTRPTVMYQGPARLTRAQPKAAIEVDLESLDGDFAPAPAFAIARMGDATVHASPVFRRAATRMWMQFIPDLPSKEKAAA